MTAGAGPQAGTASLRLERHAGRPDRDGELAPSPCDRLIRVLAEARAQGRAALIGYLPVGYPSVAGSIAAMEAMVEAGVDVVEVGLPTAEAVLDGPVIRHALEEALRRGTRPSHLFEAVAAVSGTGAAALCMTYWNAVERYGVEPFAADLAAAGGCGLIAPDLPPEEARAWTAASEAHGLGRIFLAAHTSSTERLVSIGASSRGFVYAMASSGVTGNGEVAYGPTAALVKRIREAVDLPVCVGIGISTAAQAARIALHADGVIVGSALVRRLAEAGSERAGIEAVRAFTAELADAVRTCRPPNAPVRPEAARHECPHSSPRQRVCRPDPQYPTEE